MRGICQRRSSCPPACGPCPTCHPPSTPPSGPSGPCRQGLPPSAASCAPGRRCAQKNGNAHSGLIGLEQRGRNDAAAVGEHGVRAGHLEQAGRQAVAVGHGGLLHGAPGFVGTQPTTDRARESRSAASARNRRPRRFPHLLGGHLHGELGGAHVAGLLDHAFNGERAVVVRVGKWWSQ